MENTNLNYAHLVPTTWDKLNKIERTGWIMWKVKSPETVQQHINALRALAFSLSDSLTEFNDEEKKDLVDMLEIHDWAEAVVGDIVTVDQDKDKEKTKKQLQFEQESVAIKNICDQLGSDGERIMSLWMRFETSSDPVSTFARQLDKYQAIEQAFAYEQERQEDRCA